MHGPYNVKNACNICGRFNIVSSYESRRQWSYLQFRVQEAPQLLTYKHSKPVKSFAVVTRQLHSLDNEVAAASWCKEAGVSDRVVVTLRLTCLATRMW